MRAWMRGLIVFGALWLVAAALPHEDHPPEDGAAQTSGSNVLDVELSLRVSDPAGNPVEINSEDIGVSILEEGEPIREASPHSGEEPGEYHLTQDFAHEGRYTAIWSVSVAGEELSATFPILVAHADEETRSGTSIWLLIVGGLVGVGLAFYIGRLTAKGTATAASILVLLAFVGATLSVQANGEGDGHAHDEPVSADSTVPLSIGLGQIGILSDSQVVNGYTLTMTINVLPPDPTLIVISDEQSELIGLEVETIGMADFGKGISATGQVHADPSKYVSLSALASGQVVSVDAVIGQTVRRGQVLAVINAPEAAGAQAEVASAQSLVLQAKANRQRASHALAIARQNLARQQELAATGAFSQPSLQAARTELASAESVLAQAETTLRQARAEQATHARELARVQSLYDEKLASRRELEAAQLEAQLDRERVSGAEAQVAQARTLVANARAAVQREERIQSEGLYNRREIELAESEVTRAQGELTAAEMEVRGAESIVRAAQTRASAFGGSGGRMTITAPISGTIVSRAVSAGETVSPDQVLFEVFDTTQVWIHLELFEPDLANITIGMPVEIRTESHPDRVLYGTIGTIGEVIDPETRTAPVRVSVTNPEGVLRRNEFAQATIFTDYQEQTLSVPETAIQEIGGFKVVFVKMPNGFRWRQVVLGSSANNRVEVLTGLEPGDRVATQGSYQLRMMASAP